MISHVFIYLSAVEIYDLSYSFTLRFYVDVHNADIMTMSLCDYILCNFVIVSPVSLRLSAHSMHCDVACFVTRVTCVGRLRQNQASELPFNPSFGS